MEAWHTRTLLTQENTDLMNTKGLRNFQMNAELDQGHYVKTDTCLDCQSCNEKFFSHLFMYFYGSK